jgi:hypothetical protein
MGKQATPGDVAFALLAGHQVGDHWAQTAGQARDKGLPGGEGRKACAAHVATLTACKAAALGLLHVSGRRVSVRRAAVAVAADAAAHYLADRRQASPARGLPRLAFAAGLRELWMLGAPRPGRDDNPCLGTGGYALDQAFHVGCLWVAAVAAAG